MTFEINSAGLYMMIALLWAAMRVIRGLTTRQFDFKRELAVTLFFVCFCACFPTAVRTLPLYLEKTLKANFVPIVTALLMISEGGGLPLQPLIRSVQLMLCGQCGGFHPVGFFPRGALPGFALRLESASARGGFSLVIEVLQVACWPCACLMWTIFS
jgi:hypothetical protein